MAEPSAGQHGSGSREESLQRNILVYGTLRRKAGSIQHSMLAGSVVFLGFAKIRGKLFRVSDYPAFVPSLAGNSLVLGEVYRISDPLRILEALDNYEGFNPDRLHESEYRRVLLRAELDSGGEVSVWVYVYNRSTDGLQCIESGDFVRFVDEGGLDDVDR